MLILFIILGIAIITLAATLWTTSKWYIESLQEIVGLKKDLAALEQGRDEQDEGYQAIILSHEETIEAQAASLKSRNHDLEILMRVAETHADNCIPDYAPMLGSEEYGTMNFYTSDVHKYDSKLAKAKDREDDPDHVRTAY